MVTCSLSLEYLHFSFLISINQGQGSIRPAHEEVVCRVGIPLNILNRALLFEVELLSLVLFEVHYAHVSIGGSNNQPPSLEFETFFRFLTEIVFHLMTLALSRLITLSSLFLVVSNNFRSPSEVRHES